MTPTLNPAIDPGPSATGFFFAAWDDLQLREEMVRLLDEKPPRNPDNVIREPVGGTNRLRELLKLYGCEDVVTPVDEDAFGSHFSCTARDRSRGY